MPSSALALARRWFAKLWWLLDSTRRLVLNLLFLVLIAALVFALAKRGPPALEEKTALVLDLKGAIVEQRSGAFGDIAFAQTRKEQAQSTQLRDVLAVLDAAGKDPKIVRVVLVLDDLRDAGLATLREVAAALDRFKASGKPVVAWGSSYEQRQYYLAAHASEVLLDPFGMVFLEGFGGYRSYYRDALDRLGVTVNLVRVGTYKSFGEPFVANGPSRAAKEADSVLYNALWATYVEDVEKARKAPAGSIMRYVDELPKRLAAARGDPAKLAFDSKLVDGLKTRDELRQVLIERGAKDREAKSFRQVSFDDYLEHLKPKTSGDAVGVVVAEGAIVDGEAPAGTVGGLSTAELIRKAREDVSIKAIVLRINSPGGSVFGSELVRRELELTRASGKPVVVSMGNVAASGGYWISMASDEVIADPATITGSIGVFALLPTADKALGKIGVHTAGVTTTWLRGAGDPRLPPNPRVLDLVQTAINHIYIDFITKAAVARKTTPERIDDVAQGRVWTGAQAKQRGLVDKLGSYADALNSAAKRAGLGDHKGEAYRVVYIEPEPSRFQRLLEMFGGTVAGIFSERLGLLPAGMPPKIVLEVQHDVGWLASLADDRRPFTALMHCLCGRD